MLRDSIITGSFPDRCPSPNCCGQRDRIVKFGFSGPVRCLYGKKRQRYKCTLCGMKFCENFDKLHYRLKHKDPSLNSKIFVFFIHGLSTRKIARLLEISPHSTRIRLKRLSQRALEFHLQQTSKLSITEPICFDGLENFAVSQYEPNNINQAIGRDSLFIYDFNFAPLNRKGRTSLFQKLKLSQLIAKQGRFNPAAVRVATREIFSRLYSRRQNEGTPLTILSDEHFQYRRVVQQDLSKLNIAHVTISSKAARNYQNILFSVNHADLLIRKALAPFARETISFSKTHGQMCQKFALFMVYKNYMTPQFTNPQVRRFNAHIESPAQKLGIAERILEYSDVFALRSHEATTQNWNEDWKSFWMAEVPSQYHRNTKFVG